MTTDMSRRAPVSGADSILNAMVEEVANGFQAGAPVDLEAIARRDPERADLLRQLLPAIEAMADLGRSIAREAPGVAPAGPGPGDALGVLGDFRILREVGRGGMGVVYEAEQISLGRRVALKVLPFAAALDPRQLMRFQVEAQAAAQLHHTGIVPIYGVGCERGLNYYAMQLIEGPSLAAVVRELRSRCGLARPERPDRAGTTSEVVSDLTSGRLAPARSTPGAEGDRSATAAGSARVSDPVPPEEGRTSARTVPSLGPAYFRAVAYLGIQAAEALELAHQVGVVHRDVKPANLLVDVHGHLWITDFGLARFREGTDLTLTGDLLGTLRYMSPEQALARRGGVSHRSDQYSLGATLYELLTLEPAFGGDDRQELLRQLAFEEPTPPRHRNTAIPAELETIVLKAMAKDPEERYATAQQLADDLRSFLDDRPVRAKRPTPVQRAKKWARRNKAVVRAAGVGTLLAVAALVVSTAFVWRTNQDLHRALERERRVSYFQRIALADREWSANNLGRAVELLDRCPPDLRGWEWHYLKRLRGKSLSPLRHEANVLCATVSPDGQRIASSDQDGMVRIWDASTGRQLRGFHAHEKHARSVTFSPDGLRLASGGWDGTVKVWDAQTGELMARRATPGNRVGCVAFSPDGRRLAASGGPGMKGPAGPGVVRIWDANLGEPLCTISGHKGNIFQVSFSPDGRRLATVSLDDKEVKLWDARTGQEMLALRGHSRPLWCVTFSPNGGLIASGSGDFGQRVGGEVKLWDGRTGRELSTLVGHTDGIISVAFSPDGRRLATGGLDGLVKLWDVPTGQEALVLRGHLDVVGSVTFSPDGNQLITGSDDQTVRVWDARPWHDGEPGREVLTLRGHESGVNGVAFSPRGRFLASAGADGTVRLWDAWTGGGLRTLRCYPDQVRSVAVSPGGKLLATGGYGEAVRLWDVQTGQEVRTLRGLPRRVEGVAFSPDGRRLAAAGWDFVVRLWDVTTGEPLQQLHGHTWVINGVAFSPDGGLLASASNDGTVRIWDGDTGREVSRLAPQHAGRAATVAFSPDGRLLASGGWDRTVRVWERVGDAQTWTLRHRLRDPTGGVTSVAFSPESRCLAWGGTDATVKVWDPTSGEIQTLRGHLSWVHGVAFSPDGRRLASASQDGTVKVWDVPPQAESSDRIADQPGR